MSKTEQDLLGLIPRAIFRGYNDLIIEFEDGSRAKWYHRQDCCESVQIEEVIGDLDDLIGHSLAGSFNHDCIYSFYSSVDHRWNHIYWYIEWIFLRFH